MNLDQRIVRGFLTCVTNYAEKGALRAAHIVIREDKQKPGSLNLQYDVLVTNEEGKEAVLIFDPKHEMLADPPIDIIEDLTQRLEQFLGRLR